jgi:hypothetical protein
VKLNIVKEGELTLLGRWEVDIIPDAHQIIEIKRRGVLKTYVVQDKRWFFSDKFDEDDQRTANVKLIVLPLESE